MSAKAERRTWVTTSSGLNQKAISLAAEAGPSEPWMMLRPTFTPARTHMTPRDQWRKAGWVEIEEERRTEVAADGARGRLRRFGGAHHFAGTGDHAFTLPHLRAHDRSSEHRLGIVSNGGEAATHTMATIGPDEKKAVRPAKNLVVLRSS